MLIKPPRISHTRSIQAFTLLEVMVAMMVFSIGLIGLAGLQAAGMRNNQISYTRTLATQLVYDMADRMRNNSGIDYTTVSPSSSPNCITNAGGCNAAQMAAFDLWEMQQALGDYDVTDPETNTTLKRKNPLHNAVGFITPMAPGFTVSIGWDENLTGDTPTSCTPPTPDTITCVSMDVVP